MRSTYLEFGGLPNAKAIDAVRTAEYLTSLGYGNGDLAQARQAIADNVEVAFSLEGLSGRLCDFCFGPIFGSDSDRLKDGRDRCSRCSRTVMSTEEQFVDEYQQTRRNMELAFDIRLDVPMRVRMANAREIERKTQEKFTPTANADPRVLGFVERSSSGQELWIENGSPRMSAITTMAHELTHVWQNGNWPPGLIKQTYGKKNELVVYEGMATWAMIQYLLFTREVDFAERQHLYAMAREDEYGIGYQIFLERYPLRISGEVGRDTPFHQAVPL